MSTALIANKRITTTLAKAKALRVFVEPLITRAKDDTTHNRRMVFRHLQSKEAVKVLFDDVATEVGDRPGGYTRVVKLGRRGGDGAPLAMIELVDYNDVQPEGTGTGRKRTRRSAGRGRRRRGGQGTPPTTTGVQPQGQAATQPGTQARTTEQVETTRQVETQKDQPSEAVEQPVTEEQATPVPQRTEPQADAGQADEARETIERQKEEGDEETK